MGGWVLLTSLISIILDFLVSCISKHKLNYISKWLPNQYNGGTISFNSIGKIRLQVSCISVIYVYIKQRFVFSLRLLYLYISFTIITKRGFTVCLKIILGNFFNLFNIWNFLSFKCWKYYKRFLKSLSNALLQL